MEELLRSWIEALPWNSSPLMAWSVLLGSIALSLAVIGKAADWLVEEAVALSERSGIPKSVIGATVVSLGTTTPEMAVSVLAALKGSPGLALGNAVGSIICDTGLILGIACLIAPLPLHPSIINRQSRMQIWAGFLLVAACWPWTAPGEAFTGGGYLPQWMGFVFLALLVGYLWQSVRWARIERDGVHLEELEVDVAASTAWIAAKLVVAIALVIASSYVLIPCVREAAVRLNVPEGIIAATLVAFGTSLPELVTAVTAARHGHGDLAVGNIIGADILNVLFVSGAAAAVTRQGLHATPDFFRVLFPAMLVVLVVLRVGILRSGDRLKWPFGVVLVVIYIVATLASYLVT